MKRPAVLVLLLTFVALVGATLRVPAIRWTGGTGSGLHWVAVWSHEPWHPALEDGRWHYEVQWRLFGLEVLSILAVGGLLALALHLRGRRVAGDAT